MMYRELRMLLLTAALAVFIRGYLPAKQGKQCGHPHIAIAVKGHVLNFKILFKKLILSSF